MNENQEWVTASTLAKRLGVSTQTVRNRVRRGDYEVKEFQRGQYNGYLILAPKGDE